MLFLEGTILVDVEVKPRHLSLGQLGKGETAVREFELKVAEPDKIKITGVKIDDERFELKKKSGKDDGDSTWELKFKGSDKLDRLMAKVQIAYTGSKVTETTLQVRAQIVSDLKYTRSIFFNKMNGEYPERKIEITSRTGKKVHLKKIEDPDGLLELETGEMKGEKVVVVARLKDTEQNYGKPQRHTLLLETSDPDEPQVKITYSITSRQPNRRSKQLNLSKLRDAKRAPIVNLEKPEGKKPDVKSEEKPKE